VIFDPSWVSSQRLVPIKRAFEILDKERASRALQIKEFRDANGHVAPVRPPYWVQMRKHLQFLIGRGPLDLFDPSLATREDSERLLREAVERLSEVLDIYTERRRDEHPTTAG
jgi:hypothetical protein